MKPRLLFLTIPIVAVILSVAWKASHRNSPADLAKFQQEAETTRLDNDKLTDLIVRQAGTRRDDVRAGAGGSSSASDTSMLFCRQEMDLRFEKPVSSESDLQPISDELLHLSEVAAWKARGDALGQHREIAIETLGDGSGNLCLHLTLKAYRGKVTEATLAQR